jgi:hypothetical protein
LAGRADIPETYRPNGVPQIFSKRFANFFEEICSWTLRSFQQTNRLPVAEDDELSGVFHRPKAAPSHFGQESPASNQTFDVLNTAPDYSTFSGGTCRKNLEDPAVGAEGNGQGHGTPPPLRLEAIP